MLITDRFVLLNMPKTGSTFAREVIKTIHARRGYRCDELILPNIKVKGRSPDQHGTFDQIPSNEREKTIVTVVRNPFSKASSSFRYGWWKENPGTGIPAALERFPHFPELSFEEYLALTDLSAARKLGGPNLDGVGNQTLQFIQMYFRDAPGVIGRLDDTYLSGEAYKVDLPAITFLRAEHLNDDLATFLTAHGYDDADAEWCRFKPPVNVSEGSARADWSAPVVQKILRAERLVFRILGDAGIRYSAPEISGAVRSC